MVRMAVGDPLGKPQDRLSSLSPKRDKAKQKPRKDWLVAVGQGLSPASTRSENGATARKKVDPPKFSFSGLEHEVNYSGFQWIKEACTAGNRTRAARIRITPRDELTTNSGYFTTVQLDLHHDLKCIYILRFFFFFYHY